jgi:hypothetical protein
VAARLAMTGAFPPAWDRLADIARERMSGD